MRGEELPVPHWRGRSGGRALGEESSARPGGTARPSLVFPRPGGGGVCPCVLFLGGFFPWQRLGDIARTGRRSSRSPSACCRRSPPRISPQRRFYGWSAMRWTTPSWSLTDLSLARGGGLRFIPPAALVWQDSRSAVP